jgi:hypothetical protein
VLGCRTEPNKFAKRFLQRFLAARDFLRAELFTDGKGGPNHWEIGLRDADGYKVVLASPDGSADGDWRP